MRRTVMMVEPAHFVNAVCNEYSENDGRGIEVAIKRWKDFQQIGMEHSDSIWISTMACVLREKNLIWN